MNRLAVYWMASAGFANALLAQAGAGKSDGTTTNAPTGAYSLGNVTVTAPKQSGFPDLGATVTPKQMSDKNAKTLAEAVSEVPGVYLEHIGPRNEAAALVRGYDLRQVPVFIDGMPVYVPYDGYVDIGRFWMFNASQVTVEKGFSSILYGPNTLGGAINVVTRAPTRKVEGDVGFGVEMDRRGQTPENYGYFDIGTRQGQFYYQASGSYDNSRFFTLPDSYNPPYTLSPPQPHPIQPEGERINSGSKDWSIQQRIGFIPYPDKNDEYSITYTESQADKGIPSYVGSQSLGASRYWTCPEWDKNSIMLATRTELSDAMDLKTRTFWDHYKNRIESYDNDNYNTQTRRSSFDSTYNDFTLGSMADFGLYLDDKTTLDAMAMFKHDEHREHEDRVAGPTWEPLAHTIDQTWSFGLAGVRKLTDELEMTAGVRYDYRQTPSAQNDNVLVGDRPTKFPTADMDAKNGQIGFIYHLDKTNEIYVTYAHTTRLPTMKDRFSYRLGTAIPNPSLQPEDSDNFELGFRGAINDRIHVNTAVFCDHTHNTIQSVPLAGSPGTNQSQNVGVSRIVGWEVGGDILLCKTLTLGSSFTLLDREDVSDPTVKLTDTPKDALDVYLSWKPFEHFELRPDVMYQSGRFSSVNAPTSYVMTGNFALFNIMAQYEIFDGATLQVGVENIGDKLYEYQYGYPEAGRTYFVRANYKF